MITGHSMCQVRNFSDPIANACYKIVSNKAVTIDYIVTIYNVSFNWAITHIKVLYITLLKISLRYYRIVQLRGEEILANRLISKDWWGNIW